MFYVLLLSSFLLVLLKSIVWCEHHVSLSLCTYPKDRDIVVITFFCNPVSARIWFIPPENRARELCFIALNELKGGWYRCWRAFQGRTTLKFFWYLRNYPLSEHMIMLAFCFCLYVLLDLCYDLKQSFLFKCFVMGSSCNPLLKLKLFICIRFCYVKMNEE